MRKFKRYSVWTDETMWNKTAVESGLRYGVYDHKENKKVSVPKCVTYQEASMEAEKLNNALDNPFDY